MKKGWGSYIRRSPRGARTTPGGIVFASLAEKRRWGQLQILLNAGLISGLERQKAFPLESWNGQIQVKTPTGRVARYTPDFVYTDTRTGVLVVEDVKGYADPVTALRIAVFEAFYEKKVTIVKMK